MAKRKFPKGAPPGENLYCRIISEHTGQVVGGGLFVKILVVDKLAILNFGDMIGQREFSLETGYGVPREGSQSERKIAAWFIHAEDLAEIRNEAREQYDLEVKPRGRPKARAPKPRTGKPAHPKQLNLFGGAK